jgi:hypothetical protein
MIEINLLAHKKEEANKKNIYIKLVKLKFIQLVTTKK